MKEPPPLIYVHIYAYVCVYTCVHPRIHIGTHTGTHRHTTSGILLTRSQKVAEGRGPRGRDDGRLDSE